NLRGYGVALVIVATVVTAAVYVHQTARHWETPAILASLGLGLACAGWDLCTKRPGWLWSILAQLLLGFSIASALLHGWNIAAHALFLIAGVSFFAFAFVEYARVQRRSQRALEAAMRELSRGVHGNENVSFQYEGSFRDDGQRLVVYPNRRQLLGQCAIV